MYVQYLPDHPSEPYVHEHCTTLCSSLRPSRSTTAQLHDMAGAEPGYSANKSDYDHLDPTLSPILVLPALHISMYVHTYLQPFYLLLFCSVQIVPFNTKEKKTRICIG